MRGTAHQVLRLLRVIVGERVEKIIERDRGVLGALFTTGDPSFSATE